MCVQTQMMCVSMMSPCSDSARLHVSVSVSVSVSTFAVSYARHGAGGLHYVCVYVCTHVYMYICMYMYVCMFVHMYACSYVCMLYVYIHMYICHTRKLCIDRAQKKKKSFYVF